MQLRIRLILAVLVCLGFFSCQNKVDSISEEDNQQVEDLLKTQQEKSDSAKRALGIE